MRYSWDLLQPLRAKLPALEQEFMGYYKRLSASALAAADGASIEKEEGERRAYAAGMEQRITEILLENGLNPADYCPHYRCPLCKDTGFRMEGSKKVRCTCQIVRRADQANGAYDFPTFAQFDLSVFPDGEQRERMQRHKDRLFAYAEQFPQTEKQNFLLLGKTGLGKSFLLSCVFQALRQKQVPVRFLTAYQLSQAFRAQHFGEKETLPALIRVPFLAVDDLGTEPMLRNITLEYFNTLLEERLRQGKHTGLVSNLTPDQLMARYGERIASRLLGNGRCDVLGFSGRDIRLHPLSL
ncbi:MAG: ATP-binding protein [Acutalibacteraceae bacterium]